MHPSNPTHGICQDCLGNFDWSNVKEKSLTCIRCMKDPDIIQNQEGFCTSCYLKMKSPAKSEFSGVMKGHKKSKSFYRPVEKKQILNSSFLSSKGKLIKKIEKLFNQFSGSESQLIKYLNKKSLIVGECTWEKLTNKINKSSSIIYIFIGKKQILGAFHTESLAIGQNSEVMDSESGIFISDRTIVSLEFFRVNNDKITYSSKSNTIKFGSPSSFDIILSKQIKVITELKNSFEWVYFFVYRP